MVNEFVGQARRMYGFLEVIKFMMLTLSSIRDLKRLLGKLKVATKLNGMLTVRYFCFKNFFYRVVN